MTSLRSLRWGHLANKAEHAVDLETGAAGGVTVQDRCRRHEGDVVCDVHRRVPMAI